LFYATVPPESICGQLIDLFTSLMPIQLIVITAQASPSPTPYPFSPTVSPSVAILTKKFLFCCSVLYTYKKLDPDMNMSQNYSIKYERPSVADFNKSGPLHFGAISSRAVRAQIRFSGKHVVPRYFIRI
ncbi:hypothetical protein L9F63_023472, partial [Diploptera punctata]